MAKDNKCLASWIDKETGENTIGFINIFDIPYDIMDTECGLAIWGNLELGRCKNREWPDLSNVYVSGAFNCSDFTIGPDTVLPQEMRLLDCSHAISDLEVLNDKLPATVSTIIVRTAILNNIKNDKNGALDIARRFADKYSSITVTDGKRTLEDIFYEIEQKKAKEKEVQSKTPEKKQTVEFKKKTDEWLTTDETVALCKQHSKIIAEYPEDKLARLVQIARSPKTHLGVKSEILLRDDNAQVLCVNKNDIDLIANYILESTKNEQSNQGKKETKKQKAAQTEKPTPKTEPQNTTKPTVFHVGNRDVQEVEIKKYIPKKVYASIRAKCGTNTDTLREVLQEINKININPAGTDGNKVVYIEYGEVRVSLTVKFKSARCLCQGFSGTDDSARIVWGVSGNTFVATDFFKEHEHCKKKYQSVIRNMNIDLALLNLDDFLLVENLIKDLSDNSTPPEPKPEAKPEPKPKQKKTTKMVMSENQADTVDATTVAPQVENAVKKQTKPKTTKTIKWVEMYSVHHNLTSTLARLATAQSILLEQMRNEKNTANLIAQNDSLQQILQHKKKYEAASKKIKEFNTWLAELQEELKQNTK